MYGHSDVHFFVHLTTWYRSIFAPVFRFTDRFAMIFFAPDNRAIVRTTLASPIPHFLRIWALLIGVLELAKISNIVESASESFLAWLISDTDFCRFTSGSMWLACQSGNSHRIVMLAGEGNERVTQSTTAHPASSCGRIVRCVSGARDILPAPLPTSVTPLFDWSPLDV